MSRSIALGLALLGALVVVLFVWRSPETDERAPGPRAEPEPRQESPRPEPGPEEPSGVIEGTVVWPDGQPAENFAVGAVGPFLPWIDGFDGGKFRLTAMMPGEYLVEVRASREGALGHVHQGRVRPDGAPLALVLETVPTFDLSGSVVDEAGVPLASFSVEARRKDAPARAAEGQDGRFVLKELVAGEWRVELGATAHQSIVRTIRISPGRPAVMQVALGRVGLVRGRVLDETDRPVAGAVLRGTGIAFGGRAASENTTDDEGRFAFEALAERPWVWAAKAGHAPSAGLELEVAGGRTIADLVLRLRASCRLAGSVLDERGAGVRALVQVQSASGEPAEAESDAQGRFSLDDLPPGAARIAVVPDLAPLSRAMSACALPASSTLMIAWWSGALHAQFPDASAELRPGAPASVELHFVTPEPVRVQGRITMDGQPAACTFLMHGAGFTSLGMSGPEGRFELTLQHPGPWRGAIAPWCAWPEGESLRAFEVEIPASDPPELALALDALPTLDSLDDLWR